MKTLLFLVVTVACPIAFIAITAQGVMVERSAPLADTRRQRLAWGALLVLVALATMGLGFLWLTEFSE